MRTSLSTSSCECCDGLNRRHFLKTTATITALLPFGSVVEAADRLVAKPRAGSSETLVAQFYKSLTDEQRKGVCFPFGHELQSKIDNNWHITQARVSQFTGVWRTRTVSATATVRSCSERIRWGILRRASVRS